LIFLNVPVNSEDPSSLLNGVNVSFARSYADYSLFAHPCSSSGRIIDDLATPWAVSSIVLLGGVLLVILFPDGRLPVRYLRGVVWMAVGGTALTSLWWCTWSKETALGRVVIMLGQFGGTVLFLSCMASVFAILERLQNAEARERQQIKWFGYDGAAVFLSAVLFLLFAEEQTSEWLVFAVILGGLLAIPVTVGVAILKYHLYDIDLLINRTLVYATLTATLALTYMGSVVALQYGFRAISGGTSHLAVVVSTLVIAALFAPLRRWVQGFVDRRFYRRKYDARSTLECFSTRLRDETDLDAFMTSWSG
jgi:hypothetical protein